MSEWMQVEIADGLSVRLVAGSEGLQAIEFRPEVAGDSPLAGQHALLAEAAHQLREYFQGRRRIFDLPLDIQGTDFQKRVWRQLEAIPYGEVRTYSDLARAIGSPSAVRAVGAANGSNPLPIVLPCHRVIGSNGTLVGYGGGLPLKRRLLQLEGCTTMLFAG